MAVENYVNGNVVHNNINNLEKGDSDQAYTICRKVNVSILKPIRAALTDSYN